MSLRDQDLVERISRAEKDLLYFKNSQAFGKDVTIPKVIQRFNSDGTPTTWDIIGTYTSLGGGSSGDVWRFHALLIYKAFTQLSPYAIVYANIQINPSNTIVSVDNGSISAFPITDDLFDQQGRIRFDVAGAASPGFGSIVDPTVDRLYVKLYVLATDDGTMELIVPYSTGVTGNNGTGTLVPLT